jgi:selenophosphate synthetase-related protein
MIQVIYIPVLFVCMAGHCEFMQTQIWFKTDQQCRAVIEAQKENMQKMALKGGQMVTQLEGTCITLRNGML